MYKWCCTYTRPLYILLPGCTSVSSASLWFVLRMYIQRMYTALSSVADVCVVEDTTKRILILCFFPRAHAVPVFEFKRWNLFQRPASLYPLHRVLTPNLYAPARKFHGSLTLHFPGVAKSRYSLSMIKAKELPLTNVEWSFNINIDFIYLISPSLTNVVC